MSNPLVPLLLCALAVAAVPRLARAQEAANEVAGIAPAAGDLNLIRLNLPDNVELKVLIDYVSQHLGMNILYDERTVTQKITLRSPASIHQDSLLGLLESALKMNGLTLVDAEEPGWRRIVQAQNLQTVAQPSSALPGQGELRRPTTAMIQLFQIRHGDVQRIDAMIKPFLTQPGGNSLTLPEQRLLIVTDYASNVARVAELVAMVDRPRGVVTMEFVPLRHMEAGQAAQQVAQLLAARQKAQGTSAPPGEGIELLHDPRTNEAVVIGTPERVRQAVELIQSRDVPLGL
jgi:general secretion pathway protein D